MDRGDAARRAPDPGFLLHALRVLGLAAAVALAVMLLVAATEVFLLAFAGVLVAVLLRAPTDWLSRHTGLSPRPSLALVTLAIVAALAGVGWLMVPSLIDQARQFVDRMPQVVHFRAAVFVRFVLRRHWLWLGDRLHEGLARDRFVQRVLE